MQWNTLPFWAKAVVFAIIAGAIVFVGYKFPPAELGEA